MTSVSVLVPWRGGLDGTRDTVWAYMQTWWAARHPQWELVTGSCPDDGPWIKGLAVRDALSRASGDVIVVADADCLCEQMGQAVLAVVEQGHPWAVPHRRVNRLSQEATDDVMAGGSLPNVTRDVLRPGRRARLAVDAPIIELYNGMPGGGLVVLPRQTLVDVPMDPRFGGWGHEDEAWGRALAVMVGSPWRGNSYLWHLWHTPQDRISRAVGSEENVALNLRYRQAGTSEQMRVLLDEITW